MKFVIFTKLASSTSYKRVHITYKIDTRTKSNLKPFKIFRMLFPKSMKAALPVKNSVILQTYNQSSIEQLGVCIVISRHKNKTH